MPAYDLAQLETDHPKIWTDMFLRCLAARLLWTAGSIRSFTIRERLGRTKGRPRTQTWVFTMAPFASLQANRKTHSTIASKTLTEHAACAVAGAILPSVGLQFDEVTVNGDRADYWLADAAGVRAGAMEISGLVTSRLKTRYKKKRAQILKNKGANPALVSVTSFGKPLLGYACRVR